ncbi:MAG TPA: PAS domain-containing protein, partial [Burkholderiaceae bacterium]|nr:PAS domain-containing protein [Burkholderiaceae bacterium]
AAWLAQSHDLLALTDAAGRIQWCNPAFERSSGIGVAAELASLAPPDWRAGVARRALTAALRSPPAQALELELRAASGAALWVDARVTALAEQRLWTLRDTSAGHELAARAQHLSELLDIAQEFGRLGVWEREIPSGRGRWDRHVFGFWGMEPSDETPDYARAASHIHPEDRSSVYVESTQRAGRYAQRYRVLQPDGSIRRIHSQWEVKNSPEGMPDRTVGVMVDDTEVYELARSLDSATTQLRIAAELADIVLWRHDLKTGRVHYNRHGFKVLGIPYRSDGLPIDEARAYTHPDDRPKLEASAAQALQTDGPVDAQTRHRWPDGSWRHMLVRRVVERDAAGQALAFVGVSLDLTEQAERSRRAEQLSQRLEAAARAARVGIWVTQVGAMHTEWNAQMFELFDMVGAPRAPTLDEWIARCIHPDDRARVGHATRGYVRAARGALEIEFRSVRRDATVRWIVLRADIERSEPEALRVFGIAVDVTERHDAQAALHAISERAALIARHAGIGTWERGAGGPVLWDEQMFRLRGLEPRPVAPNRAERLALTHPDDRAFVLDGATDVDAGTTPTAYEFRVRLPDGSYRWLASRSATLRDADGKVLRRVGVNWDVTEAKNAELARQQALLAERESQAKSQFLSRMSHELRTPLNAVLGFTQLLQLEAQQLPPNGARAERLEHIRTAGEHLLTLIDDVLDLSSLQAGMLALEPQDVTIAAAVGQSLPLLAELAGRQRVVVHRGALDGTVRADPTRLRQVLLNLLTNAIKYNRAGGQVIVDAAVEAGLVRLRVRDTGRGLRPDQIDQLFEPFNRLGAEADGIAGSGIGLTIVKALVEGMGGRVDVSSVPGRGSVFEVTLPAVPVAEVAARAAPPVRATAAKARSGQLLYIEDNSVNVLLVEELVKSLSGLRIASEATGAAGVARARVLQPDLVLVDMQLPDFDGFEVLRQMRTHPETVGIRCIALSANAMPDDIERGLAAGFDDYWTKPIKFKPFLDALDRLFPASADHITDPAAPGRAA